MPLRTDLMQQPDARTRLCPGSGFWFLGSDVRRL